MPVFFRLLFECGLRCSEARLLLVGDVDLENGCLTIRQAKNRNSRLVMVSASMLKASCATYADAVHPFPEQDAFFFPGATGLPMTLGNVYKTFGVSCGGQASPTRATDPESTICDIPLRCTDSKLGRTRQRPDGNAADPQDLHGS